jgi:uncharacterized membrane protein required for colicin V production
MNSVDLAVLAVLALNAVLGSVRGFARQSLKLAGVVLAVWAALNFYGRAGAFLSARFDLGGWGPVALDVLGFLAVGLGVYLAANLLAHLARSGLEKARLGGADRFLGLLFGVFKGALLAAIALHFVDPIAPHLPEGVSRQFYGGPGGNPPESRAYAFYREHLKANADELQKKLVDETKAQGGRPR